MNISEDIKVGVVFTEKNQPRPRWFIWQRRKYEIKEVTYTWRVREGNSLYLYFNVTDENNVYEISFNQKTLKWKLVSVREAV
ncbi:MAG: hypothetical protein ABII27_01360 [bacterium]